MRELVLEFAAGHNAATSQYKAAFARVGAKMWNMDDCHQMRPARIEGLLGCMINSADGGANWAFVAPCPLTVCDSYPHVRRDPKLRDELRTEVGRIFAARQREVARLMRKLRRALA